jgi:integrase
VVDRSSYPDGSGSTFTGGDSKMELDSSFPEMVDLPVARRAENQLRLDRFLAARGAERPGDPPATSVSGALASVSGSRSGDTPKWDAQVERFLGAKTKDDSAGVAWTRRMRWELVRAPRLLRRIDPSRVPREAEEVTAAHILAIRRTMKWEKATFAIHFAALRQFLRWAENPVAHARGVWRLPSGEPSRRRWLARGQLERLYSAAEGRGKILVALEGLNGLRRVEVLRLRRKDLLFEEGCLRVLGKGRYGGKWRTIPMHGLVRDLLRGVEPSGDGDQRLFPLSSSGADRILQGAAVQAGFPQAGVRVSHHDLRRTFGRLAYESGVDLIQLKNLFGHSSVEMTVHYIGIDADRMRQGLNRLELRATPEGGRTRRVARGGPLRESAPE